MVEVRIGFRSGVRWVSIISKIGIRAGVCPTCFGLFLLWQDLEICTNKAAANLEEQWNQLRAAVQHVKRIHMHLNWT